MLKKFMLSVSPFAISLGAFKYLDYQTKRNRISKEWCNCHEYCHGFGYVAKEEGVWSQSLDGYKCICECHGD